MSEQAEAVTTQPTRGLKVPKLCAGMLAVLAGGIADGVALAKLSESNHGAPAYACVALGFVAVTGGTTLLLTEASQVFGDEPDEIAPVPDDELS